MGISYFIICVFALLINKVSLQVVGVIGRSTILPCSSNDNGNKHTDINVRWRHNETRNVCDITKDKCAVDHQEPGYKNRTEVFPNKFDKGNFSLKLSHLTSTDAGEYQCFIIHSSTFVKLQLLLNESTADKEDPIADKRDTSVDKEDTATKKGDTTTNKGDTTAETRLMSRIIIPVLSFVLLLLVCVIIITYKKRCYKSSGSGVSGNGGHLSDNDSFKPLSNTPESANQNQLDFSGLQTNI